MYTIYVNDCPLTLVEAAIAPDHPFALRYPGNPKFFLQITATLQSGSHEQGIQVRCADVEQAWIDFQKHYSWVPAAGGAVLNAGRLLCIHRRGYWDLPKGKHEVDETNAEAALREVEEETGVSDLQLGEQLPTTYHTYTTKKGKRVLKPTYWYVMTSKQEELTPQTEEDIGEARWIGAAEAEAILGKMYPSLRVIARTALAQALLA